MDPVTGRFESEDPAKKGINWFAYCRNNPIHLVDNTGKDELFEEEIVTLVEQGLAELEVSTPEEALPWMEIAADAAEAQLDDIESIIMGQTASPEQMGALLENWQKAALYRSQMQQMLKCVQWWAENWGQFGGLAPQ